MAQMDRWRMSNDMILVRPVTRADYAGWRPLWDGYNEFYGRHGPNTLPEDITAATWNDSLRPKSRCMHLLRRRVAWSALRTICCIAVPLGSMTSAISRTCSQPENCAVEALGDNLFMGFMLLLTLPAVVACIGRLK